MTTPMVLDGKAIAERIKQNIRQELAKTVNRPTLAILSFQNPASEAYLRAQALAKNAKAEELESRIENITELLTVARDHAIDD